jgi:hypothetical protein
MSSGGTTIGATRNRTELFLKYRNQARGATRPIGLPGSSPTSRQAEKCAPPRRHSNGVSGAPMRPCSACYLVGAISQGPPALSAWRLLLLNELALYLLAGRLAFCFAWQAI